MIGPARVLAILGSVALHLGVVVAVLALAVSLRHPEPLFVDLTGASPTGEERAARAASPRGAPARVRPAREAERTVARAPWPAPPEPARPAETPPVPAPSFSASRESAPAEQPAPALATETPVAETRGGASRSVSSDMPAHSGEPPGAVGGGGSRLALADPGTRRGDVPAEFGPYLARFRQRIQESVVYPLAARRRGLAGRVEIELVLEPSGRIRDVAVVSSSSYALLDEAAVEAVKSLEAQPLPGPSTRQSLRVRLPVVFQLR